jgi:hypothetical protein
VDDDDNESRDIPFPVLSTMMTMTSSHVSGFLGHTEDEDSFAADVLTDEGDDEASIVRFL